MPPKSSNVAINPIDSHKKAIKKQKIKGATERGGRNDAWRFYVIWAIMLVGAAVLIGRAYFIQIVNTDFYLNKAKQFITSERSLPAMRGIINDTNGVPLAVSAPLATVIFSPYDYAKNYYQLQKKLYDSQKGKTSLAKEQMRATLQEKLAQMDLAHLAEATGYPLESLQQAVGIQSLNFDDPNAIDNALPSGAGSKRLVLMDRVSPERADKVKQLRFAGVNTSTSLQRFYLQAEPNAQVLGYMANSSRDDGYKGRAGIEKQYDEALSGQDGRMLILKNADQAAIKYLQTLKKEVPAQDIDLTLDARLQYVLYKELEQVGRGQSARWASGIVVEIATGNVLAMGSWPSFNSNDLTQRVGANERNRVVLDVFEPGSVMKPFTVAAALQSHRYNTNSLIETNGSIRVGGSTIRDSGNYGAITLAKLIQKSSNVASTKIALSLPADAIAKIQQDFGFGQKTALNFPAEASGRVDIPKDYELARRATLSYGYGQEVTLAQIAQAYATLGAGGVLHPLRLIKSAPKQDGITVIDKAYADDIVAMMELVTMQGGTAKQAAIDGYRVAGKTGTSRRSSPLGGYAKGEYRAIFAGVAPASNPKFAVAILVEDPRQQFYGGAVAAPVFSRVMREALRLYNVPFDKPLADAYK